MCTYGNSLDDYGAQFINHDRLVDHKSSVDRSDGIKKDSFLDVSLSFILPLVDGIWLISRTTSLLKNLLIHHIENVWTAANYLIQYKPSKSGSDH